MSQGIRLLLFLALGGLLTGTVFKKKDAVELTQTDPVGYEEKRKEAEEGKKGPPAPAFQLFPREGFQTDPPIGEPREEADELREEEAVDWDLWLEDEELFKPEEETDDTFPS